MYICVCVCMCVCGWVGGFGCVCVRIQLYLRIYEVDFNRIILTFFVFLFCIGEENNFV